MKNSIKQKSETCYMLMTLEELEDDYWREHKFSSSLVINCHGLRKKPLSDFEIGDLRIMIGQNIGLNYLIPIAIDILSENILAQGNFFKGDLLKVVLMSEKSYWQNEIDKWKYICNLYNKNHHAFENEFIPTGVKEAYLNFKEINLFL